jgi:hypothetical protein
MAVYRLDACRAILIAPSAILLLVLNMLPVLTEPSQRRMEALDVLTSAYTAYRLGRNAEGRAGVEKALVLDPNLAYANIVRGEMALKEEDWPLAQKYFERGLVLLKQPDQPLVPRRSTKVISAAEVEASARCFLGYVYIKRAKEANQRGKTTDEQLYLDHANQSLRAGLALTSDKALRDMCNELLRMFR